MQKITMLTYPSYYGGKDPNVKTLTRSEEAKVVDAIKALMSKANDYADEDLLQKFITSHEKLRYFRDITVGLWAVESPDDVIPIKQPIQLEEGAPLPVIWQIQD